MHCEYTVTYKDFKESIKAYRQISKAALIAYCFRNLLFSTLAFVEVVFCLYAYFTHDQEFISGWAFITGVTVVVAILLPIIHSLQLRRMFKLRTSLVDGKVSLDFDEKAVRFTVPNRAEVSYPWTSFTAYREGPRTATLFIGKAAFHTIPKCAMDESGWSELRRCVIAHTDKPQ